MPTDPLSDNQLIERVKAGELETYGEIMRRYQNKLLFYAEKLVGSHDKAADVVQESFIKAYVNIQSFNPKYPFANWIYRIVHNEAINHIKKYRREISLEDNDWISQNLRASTNLEQELVDKEVSRNLRSNLKKLPLKYRAPLMLFYIEGMSYKEIAQILAIPQATVGTNISRGKKILRIVYSEHNKQRKKHSKDKSNNVSQKK